MREGSFPLPVLTGDGPLYDQIYRHIAAAIRSGQVPPGAKLPSKRQLCATLGVSMSTVEGAYSLLTAEGYAIPRPRSGYVAARLALPDTSAPPPPPVPEEEPPSPWRYRFSTGGVDTSVFPFSTWARIAKEAVYQNPALLERGHVQGDAPLRAALAGFLAQYRGVRCTPGQIVIGAGVDWLLTALLQLLPEAGELALEDPGYPAAYAVARRMGRRPVPLRVDASGLCPEALEQSGARLCYVTPSHQFPLGATMPAGRRSRLLQWAGAAPGRYLIEDDYDSEFRYDSRPIPAMQGLDQQGRVVYLGTFSRSLAPSIRAAYMILPPDLLERYREDRPQSVCPVSRFEQEALRRFIEGGHYARHLRRSVSLYRKKRALLLEALSAIPGGEVSGDQAGLHLLFTLPRLSEGELTDRAAALGVEVQPLSRYCHGAPPPPSTVVLGYAGLSEEELAAAAALLKRAWT